MPNLVGIGNSQVPTNSMLGGLAYQDPTNTIIQNAEIENISEVTAKISKTVATRGLFVYDTRKDSDGGAWRKRTKHTTWYNEPLGTETRGHRAEFPAVAVIVATTAEIIVYDADDPNLSMWMIFTINNVFWTNHTITSRTMMSAHALNGVMVTGSNGGRLCVVDFISDSGYVTEGGANTYNHHGIVNRNNLPVGPSDGGSHQIANHTVNDVAMTVEPNSPINPITGIPSPTIAAATDDGVTVIREMQHEMTGNQGTHARAFDISTTIATNNTANHVSFNSFGDKVGYMTRSGNIYALIADLPYDRDVTARAENDVVISLHSSQQTGDGNDIFINNGSSFNGMCHTKGYSVALAGGGGRQGLHLVDYTRLAKANDLEHAALYASIRTQSTSGWMPGRSRGAWLGETDVAATISDSAVYTDDFANNDNGWTFADNASEGVDSGVLTIADNASARATDSNALNGVATDTKLLVSFTVTFGGAGQLNLDDDGAGAGLGGNTNLLVASASGSGTQRFSAIYTKTASDRIRFIRSSGGDFEIDTVRIREMSVEDRSIDNNGLAVVGSLSTEPVAEGAELRCWSGFSSSNFLQLGHNSALDFGTGRFCIMLWFNPSNNNDHQTLISRTDREVDISLLSSSNNQEIRIYSLNNAHDLRAPDSNYQYQVNAWQHVCVCYTGGDTKTVYINGKLDRQITGTDGQYDINSGNTAGQIHIGCRNTGGTMAHPADHTKITLVKISDGEPPTPEQVQKIYNEEKALFAKDAKCTLHGSSNVVTAVAYDDSNNVLHAGTSSGRSDFTGLNRINNTTTAVATAISASNELVAEQ